MHEFWYGDTKAANQMKLEELELKFFCKLDYLNHRESTLSGNRYNHKMLQKQVNPNWPAFFDFAASMTGPLNMKNCKLRHNDMEQLAIALAENPRGTAKISSLNLSKNVLTKQSGAHLTLALKANKSLLSLDLSSCKLGVSGVVQIASALENNDTLKSLNLYRNILDVDGARAIAKTLKKNSTISFLDIGHNRIRQTGLKVVVDGILENPNSALRTLCVRSNFINDDGLSYLFEKLVVDRQ